VVHEGASYADRRVDRLAAYIVTWGLQQLVLTSPSDLHEVPLVEVCTKHDLPAELRWKGGKQLPELPPEYGCSFHLLNDQVLTMSCPAGEPFSGYARLDERFRRAIEAAYPAIVDEYLPRAVDGSGPPG
jgi:hypothetical protein